MTSLVETRATTLPLGEAAFWTVLVLALAVLWTIAYGQAMEGQVHLHHDEPAVTVAVAPQACGAASGRPVAVGTSPGRG